MLFVRGGYAVRQRQRARLAMAMRRSLVKAELIASNIVPMR